MYKRQILYNVISKVSHEFEGVKIKVLNSYELASNQIDDDIDLVIVLGGDGTCLLYTSHQQISI